VLAPQPFWESDLSALTPVPAELLVHDAELRAELGTADARHLLVVEADTADAALERLGSLDASLEDLVARGAIATFDHAARYVPTAAVQRARQAQLPTAEQLGAELDAAVAGTAFRRDAFVGFAADVERARTAPPLTFAAARAVPAFGAALDALLFQQEGSYVALVTFGGVRDDAPLRALSAAGSGITFLDVKAATESLVAEQRARLLVSLGLGAVLLLGVVSLALRDARRVYRVLTPLAATTLIVIAVLQIAGVSLNLFHLISLILAAGLGLDYALFFEHAADDAGEQGRTLHAILACSGSTLLVFVLLALADLPVLRAIGLPVAIGVVANFVLALVFTRAAAPRAAH